ncbi:hypothetical protein AVEN_189948-1 [Araneus ventricosus]|uniref:Uncharacterized protein n=1 Tax=Araneus ventricosus TaxID=182803 RepID=A0A4Y2F3T3_ARAVE|nr:hypothetical protein AVEN_189948-1 [Araneus ventricosus]
MSDATLFDRSQHVGERRMLHLVTETIPAVGVASTQALIDRVANMYGSGQCSILKRKQKCHRRKPKYQSYASFHIEVYENDLQQLLDSTFWPEGCLIAEFYGKLRNDQISQELIPVFDSNHSCLDLSTNTDSKLLSLLYQNIRGLRTKIVRFYSSVASVEYDAICVIKTWLFEDIDSWHLFDYRYLVYRNDRGSLANYNRRGGCVFVAIKKIFPVNWTFLAWISKLSGFQ